MPSRGAAYTATSAVGTRARARGTDAKGLGRSVNKVDLVDVVYRTHGGISRQEASELVDTILGHVKSSLAKERRMHISGFGSFQVVRRGARIGRNPHTGEPLELPERSTLVFRPSRAFLDSLNGNEMHARPIEQPEAQPAGAGSPAIRILMD